MIELIRHIIQGLKYINHMENIFSDMAKSAAINYPVKLYISSCQDESAPPICSRLHGIYYIINSESDLKKYTDQLPPHDTGDPTNPCRCTIEITEVNNG